LVEAIVAITSVDGHRRFPAARNAGLRQSRQSSPMMRPTFVEPPVYRLRACDFGLARSDIAGVGSYT
jgi:hypothetical protein